MRKIVVGIDGSDGAAAATGLFRWLVPSLPSTARDVLVRTR